MERFYLKNRFFIWIGCVFTLSVSMNYGVHAEEHANVRMTTDVPVYPDKNYPRDKANFKKALIAYPQLFLGPTQNEKGQTQYLLKKDTLISITGYDSKNHSNSFKILGYVDSSGREVHLAPSSYNLRFIGDASAVTQAPGAQAAPVPTPVPTPVPPAADSDGDHPQMPPESSVITDVPEDVPQVINRVDELSSELEGAKPETNNGYCPYPEKGGDPLKGVVPQPVAECRMASLLRDIHEFRNLPAGTNGLRSSPLSNERSKECKERLIAKTKECSPWLGVEKEPDVSKVFAEKYARIGEVTENVRKKMENSGQGVSPTLGKNVLSCIMQRETNYDDGPLPLRLSDSHCAVAKSGGGRVTEFVFDPSVGLGHVIWSTFLYEMTGMTSCLLNEANASRKIRSFVGSIVSPKGSDQILPGDLVNTPIKDLRYDEPYSPSKCGKSMLTARWKEFTSPIFYNGKVHTDYGNLTLLELFDAMSMNVDFQVELMLRVLNGTFKANRSNVCRALVDYNGSSTKYSYANQVQGCHVCLNSGKSAATCMRIASSNGTSSACGF